MNCDNQKKSESSERGVILVFVAIVAAALIAFVALGIDTYRISSASTEKQVTADMAALAALEGYYFPPAAISNPFDPPPIVTANTRWLNAAARAEDVTRNNRLTSRGDELQLATLDNLDQITDDIVPGYAYAADSPGYVQAGIWWSAADCTLDPNCFCNTNVPALPPPCFQVCPGGDCGGGTLATAMKVGLRSMDTSRVGLTFGRIFQVDSMSVSAGGAATGTDPAVTSVMPRHLFVLIDIGRGTKVDNTLLFERNGATDVQSPVGSAIQPNGQIMDNVYRLIDEFQNAGGVKDKIAWLIYDSTVGGLGFRSSTGLQDRTYSSVTNFRNATNPANSANRLINGLVPTVNSGSNLVTALATARSTLLADPDFERVQNSIVVITNGMVDDCVNNPPLQLCDRFDMSGTAQDREDRFIDSIKDIRDAHTWVSANMSPNVNNGVVIDFNVMFFGLANHFVLRQKGSSSECMTEQEMREASGSPFSIIPYTPTVSQAQNQAEFNKVGMTPFPRYFAPIEWFYSMVRNTGGSWYAPLPPCTDNLNQPIDISNTCNSGSGAPIVSPPFGLNGSWLDSDGRLFCHPGGITVNDQVRGFLRRYTLSPSIRLVGR